MKSSRRQFSLWMLFALIGLMSVLLATPVLGVTLLSGVGGVLLMLGVLVVVQLPLMWVVRRFLRSRGKLPPQ